MQLIFGTPSEAADADGLRRQVERWARELVPGAPGWVGLVAGVARQGSFCSAVRFESEGDARTNSERPEQGDWCQATEGLLAGPATFVDSSDVAVIGDAGSVDAGFVQLMRARCADRERCEALEAELTPLFQEWRPDFLGGLRVWETDGTVTAVDSFTTEEEARAGEASEPPPGLGERFGEWQSLLADTQWYDIADPWHHHP